MPAWWLPYVVSGGYGLAKTLFGKKQGPSQFEKDIQNKIRELIAEGGVGLTEKEMGQEYQSFKDPLLRDVEGIRQTGYGNLAGRGLLRSGAVPALETGLARITMETLADRWRQIRLENQERKRRSLMQLLGLGGEVAATYGQAERERGIGEQDIWNKLLAMGIGGLLKPRNKEEEYPLGEDVTGYGLLA